MIFDALEVFAQAIGKGFVGAGLVDEFLQGLADELLAHSGFAEVAARDSVELDRELFGNGVFSGIGCVGEALERAGFISGFEELGSDEAGFEFDLYDSEFREVEAGGFFVFLEELGGF